MLRRRERYTLALLQLVKTEKIFSKEVISNLQTKDKMIAKESFGGIYLWMYPQKMDNEWMASQLSENWRGEGLADSERNWVKSSSWMTSR